MARLPAAQSFMDLIVWQKAHAFVLSVYRSTRKFPREELYGLTSQMRRSAVSIPSNIAEGFRRRSRLDKGRMLNIAQGSLEECRYQLILATDLKYELEPNMIDALEEVSRLLNAYVRALRLPLDE